MCASEGGAREVKKGRGKKEDEGEEQENKDVRQKRLSRREQPQQQ